jgi:integrase
MTNKEKQPQDQKQPKERKKRKRGGRRAHGTGSVFQRTDRKGKQWVAQLILDNGKTRQRYFNTQGEAAMALNEMLYAQRQGTLVTEKDQTVKQLVENWIENVHKRKIRESTYIEYRKLINKHIIPGLGHRKLQQLTIGHVDGFYTKKENERLSASTIRQIHAILHQALSYAVKNNLVARNVCDYVSLPRIKRHEGQPLTVEQAKELLAAAKGHRLEALFITAVLTGMREGELLALRWNDIHFEEKHLQVYRTVRSFPGRGLVEGEPKTASSRRKIVLSPFLVDVLKQHRVHQLEARLQAAKTWEDHDLVFCNIYGGFIYASTLHDTFGKLLRDAGLPHMRFHDLRHSAATLLLAKGVHIKVVQELLGHSNIQITLNIYSHVLPSLQEDAMNKLSDLFHDQDDQGSQDDTRQK